MHCIELAAAHSQRTYNIYVGLKVKKPPHNVTGAGDKTVCSEGRLKINEWKYTRAGECMPLICTVVEVPRDAVVVIGSRVMVMSTQTKLQQPGLDIVSDLTNFRMYLVAIKEVIRLDWLPLVTARTQGDPVNILSWYDGLATPYYVLCDLGFKIGLYYAIENDAIARATVAHNLPEVTQSLILDAKDVRSHHLPEVEWYAIYGTPPPNPDSVFAMCDSRRVK